MAIPYLMSADIAEIAAAVNGLAQYMNINSLGFNTVVETSPCDADASKNTAAIQAALNGGGTVTINGRVPINNTLTLGVPAATLVGTGWQFDKLVSNGTALVWKGVAGIPMAYYRTYFGGGISNLRFVGDTNNPPSCAIQLDTGGSPINTQYGSWNNIWIGESGMGQDGAGQVGTQFTSGILFTGTSVGDTHYFCNIRINNVSQYGIYASNADAADITFEMLHLNKAATGIRTAGSMSLHNCYMGNLSGYGFQIDTAGTIDTVGQVVELSGGLLYLTPGASSSRFHMVDGNVQISSFTIANNYIVDVQNATYWTIILDNLMLQFAANGLPDPLFNFVNAGSVYGYYRVQLMAQGYGKTLSAGNIQGGSAALAARYLVTSGGNV